MNYKGVSCPVCGQPFQEGDDIVVCPECGAPHHRACYKQLGHCAMEQQLHPQHLSWQNPNPLRQPMAVMTSSVLTAGCSATARMKVARIATSL